jgi:hypothetical protein
VRIIVSTPNLITTQVSSEYNPDQYRIKAQAEKNISLGSLIGFFLSKHLLFLAFHMAQHIKASPSMNTRSPLGRTYLTQE